MPLSYPTITPNDIVLSPMQVFFTPAGGSQVDLGATEGGVTLSVKTDLAEKMADQFGKTAIDRVIAGHHFQVKFTLAELTDKARIWKNAFPYMQLVNDGSGHYLGIFTMQIGANMLAVAGQMVLHPISQAASDHSLDITIDLATCESAAEVKYGPDKQAGLACVFDVYPNTAVSPARFLRYGDTTIAVTNASAGAPVAASGNTGNGTITSVAVFNGFTKTETITIQAIGTGSASSNVFEVSGSLSNILGVFTLGHTNGNTANFSSAVVSFTATQGSAAFVLGDSFTIATTAANYS